LSTSCANEHVHDTEMWAARLRSFACQAMSCDADQELNMVSEGALLIDAASAVLGAEAVDFAQLEAMLSCGAAESAVLKLMPEDTAFMLSHGQGNACLATVIAGSGAEEYICEGPTVALALLTAYVSALLAPLEQRSEMRCTLASQPLSRLH